MKDVKQFLLVMQDAILKAFSANVLCIGIQGSYARGEATAESDLDIVCILKECSFDDIIKYKQLLAALSSEYKMCGFISGKKELKNWYAGDLYQLYMDSLPLYGNLDFLKDKITPAAVSEMIKISSCNIYHGCTHNYLYDNSLDILKNLLKSAVFVMQAQYYYHNNIYLRKHADLEAAVSSIEKKLLKYYHLLKGNADINEEKFTQINTLLHRWSKENIIKY